MLRRALVSAALLAAVACAKAPAKKGTVVASGNGVAITAEELKARLDEQSPMIRNSFQSLDRKKQFLDNLVRFELLAGAAQKEGLASDPDVQFTMKKVMVSKWYQKHFAPDAEGPKTVPDAELKKYYDEHQKDEFYRPARVHAVHLFLKAEEGAKDRAQKAAEAKKLLARVLTEEKKDVNALSRIARESSEDTSTKAAGGDLGFRTQEEYEKAYGKPVAEAIFKLQDNQTAPQVVESAQGLHLVRVVNRQTELNRGFDEVKGQIASKLYSQKKTKEFDDLVKKMREDANVKIDEKELEKVMASSPAPAGGGHGMMGAGPAMPGPRSPAPAGAASPMAPAGHPAPAPAGH